MKNSIALGVCLLGVLVGSVSEAQDVVVYRMVEEVKTRAYPVSQQEALEADLVRQIEERERDTAKALKRTDGLSYAGVMSYGGGKDRYGNDDPEQVFVNHGERKVEAEPQTGFMGWASRKLGLETSPDDSLPTYEEHMSGVAKVQSLFVAPRGSLGTSVNGNEIQEVASKIALVVHAVDDKGNEVSSQPIHITPEELVALTKDPKGAAATDLGALIRSTYRTQVLADGAQDHTGITPHILVEPVYGPRSRGALIGTVDEQLLNREGKRLSTLTRDEVLAAQRKRDRAQFAEARARAETARIKALVESANQPGGNQPGGKAEGAGSKVNSLFD